MSCYCLLPFAGLLTFVLIYLTKRLFLSHVYCQETGSLEGKQIVVTGCNQGIGLETVFGLVTRGARVIMACRSEVRCKAARKVLIDRLTRSSDDSSHSILSDISDRIVCEQLDLASIDSIEAFATRMKQYGRPIDVLVNNAGISLGGSIFGADGIESHIRVNHLGHFLLVQRLLPLLQDSVHCARVVILSSLMHRFSWMSSDICRPYMGTAYSNSKLANVMHAMELSKRFGPQITAVSVHPGLVMTEIFQYSPTLYWLLHHVLKWFCKTPWQGAQTTLHCCTVDKLVPGAHYSECALAGVNRQAYDSKARQNMWKESERLLQLWADFHNEKGEH